MADWQALVVALAAWFGFSVLLGLALGSLFHLLSRSGLNRQQLRRSAGVVATHGRLVHGVSHSGSIGSLAGSVQREAT